MLRYSTVKLRAWKRGLAQTDWLAERFQLRLHRTEHLLLGLVREGEGVAAKSLAEPRLDLLECGMRLTTLLARDRIVLARLVSHHVLKSG